MTKLFPMIASLSLLSALAGCGGADGAAASGRIPTSAQIDSGNVRFVAGDHAGALVHYRAATADAGSAAAAWYGVYMASSALGDTATAAEALGQVQQLVPEAVMSQNPHQATPAAPHPVTDPDAPPPPRP